MTQSDAVAEPAPRGPSPLRLFIDRAEFFLHVIGLGFLLPLLRMATGDSFLDQAQELKYRIAIPSLGIMFFVTIWAMFAPMIDTLQGPLPGPMQVVEQAGLLIADHAYLEQIGISLSTLALGFLIASLVAIPLGIASGMSRTVNAALTPLVRLFKPVSPLAWLPVVSMIMLPLHVDPSDSLQGSMIVSTVTVALCSLWPTLIKTASGVANVNKELMSVARVLQLTNRQTVTKVILPSAMPLIFSGLRLSLGASWMVLTASEMLTQNPGLGTFVWDEFQSGSSDSLARIMVALLTLGFIGFWLDRLMYALQQTFTCPGKR